MYIDGEANNLLMMSIKKLLQLSNCINYNI